MLGSPRSLVHATVIALALSPAALWAQSPEGLTVQAGGGPKAIVVTVRHAEPQPCGVELQLGDGRVEKRRVEPGEAWTVPHTYAADGNYTVKAEGVLVVRGLKTAGGCKLQASSPVAVQGEAVALAAPAPAAPAAPTVATAQVAKPTQAGEAPASPPANDETRDLVVLYHRDANALRMVTSLDGTKRLASPEALQRGYSYCIVAIPQAYAAISSPELSFSALALRPLDRIVSNLAGGKVAQSRLMDCLRTQGNDAQIVGQPDFLLVQRQVVPVLARGGKGMERYEALQTVKYETLDRFATAEKNRKAQAAENDRQRNTSLDELANADSREHVASLSLFMPNDGSLNYCTLTYKDASGAAVLGYAQRGVELLSPGFRQHVQDKKITVERGRQPYHKVYATVEEFYLDLQKNPAQCAVYVDFPKQIRAVMKAIERDQGKRRYELNEIVPTAGLRDVWAQRAGHADYAASQFAGSIDASADQAKALAAQGISTKAQFDQAVADMKATKYGTGSSAGEVLAYLTDKQAAPKGQTALFVKQERERKDRAAAEQQQAEERKRQAEHAREFPYTATLSCGMNGQHYNLFACFSGKYTKTQLELRNGTQYKMYQAWEVGQAGRNTNEGMVIPLRANFAIKAQNVDETLLLSLKVKETATGRTLYEKSAGRFGVVAAQD